MGKKFTLYLPSPGIEEANTWKSLPDIKNADIIEVVVESGPKRAIGKITRRNKRGGGKGDTYYFKFYLEFSGEYPKKKIVKTFGASQNGKSRQRTRKIHRSRK